MVIKQEPFRRYTLDEERKFKPKQDTFTVRLNEQERQWLMEFKVATKIRSDSKALKMCAFAGKNMLFNTLGEAVLSYLSNPDRVKLDEK